MKAASEFVCTATRLALNTLLPNAYRVSLGCRVLPSLISPLPSFNYVVAFLLINEKNAESSMHHTTDYDQRCTSMA